MVLDAILWKWPGARCVVRGGELERWEGPMPQPSAKEIAMAVSDYSSQNIAKTQSVDRELESPIIQAMLRAFAPALGKTFDEATALLKAELAKNA